MSRMLGRRFTAHADPGTFCAMAGLSDLTPDILRRHRPDASHMVLDGATPVARASLWWTAVPPFGAHRLGLIGHYAAVDGEAARLLHEGACTELARHGCDLAVGPMDGSVWRRYRLLTERGTEPPFFLEPDNPDEWPAHFEAAGFTPLAHYYSALNGDIARHTVPGDLGPSLSRQGFAVRSLDVHDTEAEIHRLWEIASSAFARHFLYTPIAEDEFAEMQRPLLAFVRPELVQVAETNGRPVGFCFAIPDMLQARRGETIDTVIFHTIAVLPERQGRGIASLLVASVAERARLLGFRRTIFALAHEDNPSRRLERGLMRDFRRYTLFARQL
jgi:GNAT superfamily N-acetyltransferase